MLTYIVKTIRKSSVDYSLLLIIKKQGHCMKSGGPIFIVLIEIQGVLSFIRIVYLCDINACYIPVFSSG